MQVQHIKAFEKRIIYNASKAYVNQLSKGDEYPKLNQVISPKLGEILIKTTHSNNIDDAFHRVFSDYLELKLKSLHDSVKQFREKWGMDFEEFKKCIKDKTLKKDTYSFDVEKDFWEWEEAETLKKHYEILKIEWT